MPATGTNAHDLLEGGASAETINGLHGNDCIDGGADADTITGNDGDDSVIGGEGSDTLNGGDGDDVLIGGGVGSLDLEDIFISPVGGSSTYFNFTLLLGVTDDGDVDTISGGDGDDVAIAALGDNAQGGDGEDSIFGVFYARGAALDLDLRTDANLAMGNALGGTVSGFEIFNVIGTNYGDTIYANAAGSMIYGRGGADNLIGGAGSDIIDATSIDVGGAPVDDGVADIVNAGGGIDVVYVGRLDSADGGAGDDMLYINLSGSVSGLNLTVNAGTENQNYSTAVGGTISNFESFSIVATSHADTLVLNGGLTTSVNGGDGADSVTIAVGAGDFVTVLGDAGNDTLTVTGGTGGYAYLYGGAGADTMTGGAGTDVIAAGGAGSLGGGEFDDGAADVISAGGGADQISIGLGDSADGGAGTDALTVYFMSAASGRAVDLRTDASGSLSTAVGGVIAAFETYTLHGSDHADTFYGNDQNVTFTGGDGADQLHGGAGDDLIYDNVNWAIAATTVEGLFGDYRSFQDDRDADVISGGDGDDTVYIGLGDSADGGEGSSDQLHVHFAARTSGLNLDLSTNATAALGAALGGTVENFEELFVAGTAYSDTIVGGAETTAIYGLDGDDTITLGSSSPMAYFHATAGGRGADAITGNSAENLIATGEFGATGYSNGVADRYKGHMDRDVDTVDAGGGADTIHAGILDNIDGGDGQDVLHLYLGGATAGVTIDMAVNANAGVSTGTGGAIQSIEAFHIYGSMHNDIVVGDLSLQDVYGEAGDDQLTIVMGSADGGDGNDILTVSSAFGADLIGGDGTDTLTGGGGMDTLEGGDGDDIINAGDGADYVEGGDGDDDINAGAGDDTILAGYGADSIDGGDGDDVVEFEGRLSDYVIAESDGVVTVSGAQGMTTLTGVELLSFLDGEYIPEKADEGTPDNDILNGTGAGEVIDGMDGDDAINGLGGDDTLIGGTGADTLDGGAGSDTASYADDVGGVVVDLRWGSAQDGGGSSDLLVSIENVIGSDHADTLVGSDGANTLTGNGGDDWMVGMEGDDILEGGDGVNVLIGGAGVDLASYASATAPLWIDMNAGVYSATGVWDVFYDSIEGVLGGSGADSIFGDGADNVLRGAAGDDALIGAAGNDILDGGEGSDWLVGGNGDDVLIGGAGVDVYTSGAGADTFDLGVAAGWDVAFDVDTAQDRFDLGGLSWLGFLTIDADGDGAVDDTLLGYEGGNFVALDVSGLTLDQWNALVIA